MADSQEGVVRRSTSGSLITIILVLDNIFHYVMGYSYLMIKDRFVNAIWIIFVAWHVILSTLMFLTTKYPNQNLYRVTGVMSMISALFGFRSSIAVVLFFLLQMVWSVSLFFSIVVIWKPQSIKKWAFYLRPLSIIKEPKEVPVPVTPVIVSPVPGSPHMSTPVYYYVPSPIPQASSQTQLFPPSK